MKFYVERASDPFAGEAPCEGAYRVEHLLYKWRVNINSLEELAHFIKEHGELVIKV